jgi:hypothetical protein
VASRRETSTLVTSPDRHVLPVCDGVLLVPAVLPIHIPAATLGLTVAEWLNLQPSREEVNP